MKKYAALALVTLSLAGCTATSAAAPPPAVHAAVAQAEPATIYEAVWQGWEGSDRPDERWIDTSAMLVCKQIIGGIDPVVVADHDENNEVVVSAAEDYVCEVDR